MRKIHWETPELTTGINEVNFIETLNDYYLTQVNIIPTRGNNVLDLVITSTPELVEVDTVLSPKQSGLETDHGSIVFHYKTSIKAAPATKREVFDYRKKANLLAYVLHLKQ